MALVGGLKQDPGQISCFIHPPSHTAPNRGKSIAVLKLGTKTGNLGLPSKNWEFESVCKQVRSDPQGTSSAKGSSSPAWAKGQLGEVQ